MKKLGKLTFLVLMIAAGFLTSLLAAKAVISIANLYQISFITCLSFIQVYGTLLVISILKYRQSKPNKEEEPFEEVLANGFMAVLNKIIFILLSWGLSFAAFSVIS